MTMNHFFSLMQVRAVVTMTQALPFTASSLSPSYDTFLGIWEICSGLTMPGMSSNSPRKLAEIIHFGPAQYAPKLEASQATTHQHCSRWPRYVESHSRNSVYNWVTSPDSQSRPLKWTKKAQESSLTTTNIGKIRPGRHLIPENKKFSNTGLEKQTIINATWLTYICSLLS